MTKLAFHRPSQHFGVLTEIAEPEGEITRHLFRQRVEQPRLDNRYCRRVALKGKLFDDAIFNRPKRMPRPRAPVRAADKQQVRTRPL